MSTFLDEKTRDPEKGVLQLWFIADCDVYVYVLKKQRTRAGVSQRCNDAGSTRITEY